MANEVIFLSDLHLSLDKPEITSRFLLFLKNRAPQASAIYILGDLFDAWIGDDDFTPPNPKIKKALKALTDQGVQVFFQAGNRDFLVGKRFSDETGVALLGDLEIIDLAGGKTLLMHGDLLCTDDIAYQRFRQKSRSPEWQASVLAKPLFLRLLAARWYRLRSFWHKRKKDAEIMDVNQETVIKTMTEHEVTRLIHGHTHRPGLHEFEIGGKQYKRYVLADWKKSQMEILCCRGNNIFSEQV